MESNQPLDADFDEGLHLSGQTQDYLKEIAKWAKFLAIVGFVVVGLIILVFLIVALFLGSAGLSGIGGEEAAIFGAMGVVGMLFYVGIFIVFYFIPSLFLYRFATNMQLALRTSDNNSLQSSFANMKSLFKFLGIVTAVVLGIYGVMLLFGLLFGGLAAVAG